MDWRPQLPQKYWDTAMYKHQCPMCNGYFRDRGGPFTCDSCGFEYNPQEHTAAEITFQGDKWYKAQIGTAHADYSLYDNYADLEKERHQSGFDIQGPYILADTGGPVMFVHWIGEENPMHDQDVLPQDGAAMIQFFRNMNLPMYADFTNGELEAFFERRLKPRQAMAERTGDPELDALIEEFIKQNEWPFEDYGTLPLDVLKDPLEAEGMCTTLAISFAHWLRARGINAFASGDMAWETNNGDPEILQKGEYSPDSFGYQDRSMTNEYPEHCAVMIEKDGATYMVDWTASQYGYKEFPMVQRLDNGGWQREWTSSMNENIDPNITYTWDQLPIQDPGLESSLEDRHYDPQMLLFKRVMVPIAQFEPAGYAAFEDDPEHLEYTKGILPWLDKDPERWAVVIDPFGELVDGWHRVNLAHELGETEIPAWQVINPHEEWTSKTAMALNPQDLQNWIAQNGPYVAPYGGLGSLSGTLDPLRQSATSEDTEPEYNLGFLEDPHDEFYPALFQGRKTIPKPVQKKLKSYILDVLADEFPDADRYIYFTVYGSGISYNWAEEGDLDIQMWVDFGKFMSVVKQDEYDADELLASIRRAMAPKNFPKFKDLDLTWKDCTGEMMIQYYAKLGQGTKEENLASQPYACYDLETGKWLVKPSPIRPEFYGDAFMQIRQKADDIATEAEGLMDEFQRHKADYIFWQALYEKYDKSVYKHEADEAKSKAEEEQAGIKVLFKKVFEGRQEAYGPEGKGFEDERDFLQKFLEVWGIFQRLKHHTRETLPWVTASYDIEVLYKDSECANCGKALHPRQRAVTDGKHYFCDAKCDQEFMLNPLNKTAGQDTRWHISGPQNRASILEHGLNWEKCNPATLLHGGGTEWPRGQYFFPYYPDEFEGEDDIYEVNTAGLHLQPDPFHADDPDSEIAYTTAALVGPERLKLVHQAYEPEPLAKTANASVVREQIPETMLEGYRQKFSGTPVRFAVHDAQVMNTGYPYFPDGLAAFLDVFENEWGVDIGFVSVEPQHRGQGLARALLQALYDAYPTQRIRWGRIMDDSIEHLKDEFKQTYPDRTAKSEWRTAAGDWDFLNGPLKRTERPWEHRTPYVVMPNANGEHQIFWGNIGTHHPSIIDKAKWEYGADASQVYEGWVENNKATTWGTTGPSRRMPIAPAKRHYWTGPAQEEWDSGKVEPILRPGENYNMYPGDNKPTIDWHEGYHPDDKEFTCPSCGEAVWQHDDFTRHYCRMCGHGWRDVEAAITEWEPAPVYRQQSLLDKELREDPFWKNYWENRRPYSVTPSGDVWIGDRGKHHDQPTRTRWDDEELGEIYQNKVWPYDQDGAPYSHFVEAEMERQGLWDTELVPTPN